jgi:hypothetical protein
MVKRCPCVRPQASEEEVQYGTFCWTGHIGQGDRRLHCGWHGRIVRQVKVASEPEALLAVLKDSEAVENLPHGTMDEVSSVGRLDLPLTRRQQNLICSLHVR